MKKDQARYMALTTELVGLIVFSVYLGNYLDQRYQLGGMALMSLLFGTFIAWIGHVLWLNKNKSHTK